MGLLCWERWRLGTCALHMKSCRPRPTHTNTNTRAHVFTLCSGCTVHTCSPLGALHTRCALGALQVVEAGDTDVVAFDFYSRFQRPTAPPCERFAWWAERPNCKTNRLKWCAGLRVAVASWLEWLLPWRSCQPRKCFPLPLRCPSP